VFPNLLQRRFVHNVAMLCTHIDTIQTVLERLDQL